MFPALAKEVTNPDDGSPLHEEGLFIIKLLAIIEVVIRIQNRQVSESGNFLCRCQTTLFDACFVGDSQVKLDFQTESGNLAYVVKIVEVCFVLVDVVIGFPSVKKNLVTAGIFLSAMRNK